MPLMRLPTFGRGRVGNLVIDARRNLSGVCGRWYPVILDHHRFFIAISRAVVNHDGRMVLLLTRGVVCFMLFGIGRFCLGRLVFGIRSGLLCLHLPSVLTTLLIGPTLLVFWLNGLPFLELCIGLLGVRTLVLVVFHMLNYSLFMSFGLVRLCLEGAIPKRRGVGRPISVSAVPFGPDIDIWRSCRFLGAIFRALCLLPGGLRRFIPGGIGANHGRLRHIGWEKCCHGLTSRPRETSSVRFLDEFLFSFWVSSCFWF